MSGDRYVHESEVLTFMTEDGRVLDRLVAGAQPLVGPNMFDAARFLVAHLTGDQRSMDAIVRQSPALPLFGGMVTLALGVAMNLYGDNVVEALQKLGMQLDDPDVAAPTRRLRTLGEQDEPP